MRIVSRIKSKRTDERAISVLGHTVRFQKQADGTFVADVADDNVRKCLLAKPRDFWEAGAARPALKREPPKDPVKEQDPDLNAEAADLLELNLADMGKAIGGVSSIEVLRIALDLERAGQDRKGAAELLSTALEAAKTAGLD